MNGELYDYGFSEAPSAPAIDYGVYEGGFNPAVSDQNFFQSAFSKVQSYVAPIKTFSETPAGSQIMQAIYEFGRGKIDVAREKAVGAFLMTSEGKRIQAEGTRQTIAQYMPLLLIGGALLFVLMFARR